ncbi:hypothetical protein Mapa_016763 [Marchantia paleacea]|nr:hypothetical protein Mapa_016763 [Marchantia paleacea]
MNNPIIVGAQYCSPLQAQLTVAKQIMDFNHDQLVISDSIGNTLFKLDQKKVLLRELTVVRDGDDCPVVSIQKKSISFHDTYQVYNKETNEQLFSVKDKHMRDKAEETFEIELEDDLQPTFEVKGEFVRRNYHIIFRGSIVVAEVQQGHVSLSSVVTGKRKYGVVIPPEVDQAFVAAVVIIMEAIHNEGKERSGNYRDSSDSDSDY